MKFTVIGITDDHQPFFPPDVLQVIKEGKVFSGGKRHHEIMASFLPPNALWIDISVPLVNVFDQYTYSEIIVFASGDPLFFGFANTIQRMMPEAEIVVYPAFNSLQMLAHRFVLPYHNMRVVSLTGHPWHEFDRALIERSEIIGVLTDRERTPAAIARRMLDYGYSCYMMYVGEHLGNSKDERITKLTLEEATRSDFAMPNCLILQITGSPVHSTAFGLPDSEFALLDGREKMITKMPIRLLALQALDLSTRQVFWDIGFCTGSVSIEARLLFPHLHVRAFEIRPECEGIIRENACHFGAPGIDVHIGDFLSSDLSGYPRPDAVFIGGHDGRLKDIMAKVASVLKEDGIIAFNCVKSPKVPADSHRLWDEACAELGLVQALPLHIQLNDFNPIDIMTCRK